MSHTLLLLKRHDFMSLMTFFLIFMVPSFFSSSVIRAENNEEESVQALLDNAESSANIERLIELTEELKKNKIPLNEAGAEELRQLPWLNASDAQALLRYRRERGPIYSLQVLQTIIGKEKAANITPYIRYKKEPRLRKSALTKRVEMEGSLYSRLFLETTPRKGILNGKYSGENFKLYHRAEFSVPHVSASLIQEKDIGEPDIADFTSLSFHCYDLGYLKSGVLGNYKLNFGQGLLLGQGRFLSKGSDPSAGVRLSSKQLLPYTSNSESGFFQGIATTVKLDPFDVTAFYSASHLDAVINNSGMITSFGTSGYHRTELEIGRKDNVTETVRGASLLYHYQAALFSGRAGASVLSFNYPNPYDALDPEAALSSISAGTLYGIETELSTGKASLFTEMAFSEHPKDVSWIAGAECEVLPGISGVVARRVYGVHYFSPFAGAFAERGDGASNEEGYYVGVNAKVNDRLQVGAYYDQFTFPVLGSHCPYPSDGNDARLFMNWKQFSWLAWSLQLQHKYKEEQKNQGTSTLALWMPLPLVTNRLQLDCDLAVSAHVRLRSRGEVKHVVKKYLAGDQLFYGKMVYQQVGYSAGSYSLKGRFTVFNTTDYDAAIYAYEDDLPLTSSLGVYDGRGKSLFLLATWQVMKQMKLGARFETTWYDDRLVYSSGNDERATNAPGSFHLGCMLSF
ncbi:MAG: helix-hairpin-helix domain-containing protein [Chlorobium sp.]